MADLSYSLDHLRQLGQQLSGLADAMDGTARRTSWDREGIGHRWVADALEEFAGSWDDKREKLTASIRDVGRMATDSAQTFEDVDEQLAAEIAGILEGA